jgi:hypothetical protein
VDPSSLLFDVRVDKEDRVSEASDVVAPALRRWSESAPPGDERTAIVRVAFSASPEEVLAGLTDLGARVESEGAAVVVCRIVPSALQRIGELPWVRAIEEPRKFELRPRGSGSRVTL